MYYRKEKHTANKFTVQKQRVARQDLHYICPRSPIPFSPPLPTKITGGLFSSCSYSVNFVGGFIGYL